MFPEARPDGICQVLSMSNIWANVRLCSFGNREEGGEKETVPETERQRHIERYRDSQRVSERNGDQERLVVTLAPSNIKIGTFLKCRIR